ncbi:hypothetical protein SAMN05192588_2574 [Nonlabens sp. Hel1_33_55]|nr:hypothetical protein SAMN05192588_2574 [Nonlabens sp. Hel1_33_55]
MYVMMFLNHFQTTLFHEKYTILHKLGQFSYNHFSILLHLRLKIDKAAISNH